MNITESGSPGFTILNHPSIASKLVPNQERAEFNARAAAVNETRYNPGLVPYRSFNTGRFFDPEWSDSATGIAPQHARYLSCRANSEYVANVRGIHSFTRSAEKVDALEEYGYTESALNHLRARGGDLMFIPLFSTDWGPDEAVLFQVRADVPRTITQYEKDETGKAVRDDKGELKPILGRDKKPKTRSLKFEIPAGAKRGSGHGDLPADVHPIGQEILEENPDAVLIWTEGAAKADAILSLALVEGIEIVPVALTGVTMGYVAGNSDYDPNPQLAAETAGQFDHAGRLELLAWDADWRTNPAVANSLVTFGRLLEEAGATVGILDTPGVTKDGKGGVDDYLYQQQKRNLPNPLGRLLASRIISLEDAALATKWYPDDDVGRSDRLADTVFNQNSHGFDTVTQSWNSYDAVDGIWTDRIVGTDVQQIAKILTERDVASPARYASARSGRAISSAVNLAAHDPRVQMRSDECDVDPYLLNTRSSVVDLRTGEQLPHSPMHRMKKVTASGYDPDAVCPTFDTFILQCVDGDEEFRGYLQRFFGMALIGHIEEEVMGVLTGAGQNGKSTLLKALQRTLGSYARAFPAKAFTGSLTDEILMELLGTRLAIAAETGAGNSLDEQALKTITSSDTMSARGLYQARVTFEPSATLTLLTNHRPSVRANDEGTWRRMRIMPFEHKLKEGEKDPQLAMKLEAESAGILRWLIDGCLEFQAVGLGTCEAVERATQQYRADQDIVGLFIKECLVPQETVTSKLHVQRAKLKQAFDEWGDQQGFRIRWTLASFREALQERGVLPRTTEEFEKTVKGYPRWYGIALLAKESDDLGGW